MSKKEQQFTAKEISVAINNAITAALRPVGAEIGEVRLRKLREYAQALVEPLLEHLEDQTYTENGVVYPAPLSPEEVVAILLSAALFVQLRAVVQTDKVPQARVAELLFKH